MFITTEGGGGPTTASMPDQSLSRLHYTLKNGDGGRMHRWRMMIGGRIQKSCWIAGKDIRFTS